MSATAVEKMLRAPAGTIVVRDVDWVVGTDASTPMAIDYFEQMGGTRLFDPARVMFSLDHYVPPATPQTRAFHERIRAFARAHGGTVFEAGEGISHQVLVERGWLRPGQIVIGADSHVVTCGALGVFAAGVGSSELAAAMITGQMWFRVPASIRITCTGAKPAGVSAKDVALDLVRRLGADGANYQALEFAGPGLAEFTLDDRLTIASLAVEMGAKAAIFPRGEWAADADARFAREETIDLDRAGVRVARPHAPDNVVPIADAAGLPVQMVFIGTCTGGRASDVRAALHAIDRAGGRVAAGVTLVVTPASRQVENELRADGTLARLIEIGAIVTTPGCGACCGTSGVIPDDGATVVSTANRNFKARMGNPTASIFLASPAACGTAAARGRIV